MDTFKIIIVSKRSTKIEYVAFFNKYNSYKILKKENWSLVTEGNYCLLGNRGLYMIGGGAGGERRKRIKKGLKEIFWNNPFFVIKDLYMYFEWVECFVGFRHSSVGKESACKAGDPGSTPGSGRSAGEGIGYPLQYSWASFVAQLVKNLPSVWETWLWSLGWEDPLEKGKATHSSILAWRIPWTTVQGVAKSWTRLGDFHVHFHLYFNKDKKKKKED